MKEDKTQTYMADYIMLYLSFPTEGWTDRKKIHK